MKKTSQLKKNTLAGVVAIVCMTCVQPYIKADDFKEPGRLTPKRNYADVASYQRKLTIPADSALEQGFQNPPQAARLQAFWVWSGTDISKEGITKDLEAMRDEGLGGALIMHVGSKVENAPWRDRKYRGAYYWEALQHAAAEAERLGIKISLFNGPGYTGTGGPWIDESRNMRKLVWSSVTCRVESVGIMLPKPTKSSDKFYEDVAVLAVPEHKTVRQEQVLELTSKMKPDGTLDWTVPQGTWVVYRMGTTPTLKYPHPVDASFGKGLEVDKLSVVDNVFHWQKGVIEPLKQHLGKYYGTSFNGLHVDSYECGPQNWTQSFREVFMKRKGYDPVPWLATFGPPVLGWPAEAQNGKPTTGVPRNAQSRFIDSEEKTLRFEWDFRENVSRMYNDCFIAAKQMMRADNILFSYEPYAGPFNAYEGAATADIPMPVFWFDPEKGTGECGGASITGARAAGVKVIGAEAFTGGPLQSKWNECPSLFKFQADGAFVTGVNRFTLHHWAHQPFDDKYQPGMSFSHYGVHFGRFQTWFEPGKAFFKYVNRCQFLLQHGEEVVDCLSLDKESGGCDVITSHDFVKDTTRVENGQIVRGSGRRYYYFSVPGVDAFQFKSKGDAMLPEVAEKLLSLVQVGAVIVVPTKPTKSPSLKDYPVCDSRVQTVAKILWESGRYDKNLFASEAVAIKTLGLEPDCIAPADVKALHRRSGEADIYFVVNRTAARTHARVSFRIFGRQPELWQAEDASVMDAPVWEQAHGRTSVQLDLGPKQSVFVVFRKAANNGAQPVVVTAKETGTDWYVTTENGKPVLHALIDLNAQVKYADGKTKQVQVTGTRRTPLTGSWQVAFTPKLGEPFRLEFPELIDFSKHPENRVRYFSGAAVYRKEFTLDPLREDEGVVLDLGELNDIASVRVNGGERTVLWYAPYRLDIGKQVKAGNNVLEVEVINTWANAIIGDEQIPADFSVKPNWSGQFMTAYPSWFLKNEPRPSARKTFTVPANYYNAESKPLPAGLVGPVRLVIQKRAGL